MRGRSIGLSLLRSRLTTSTFQRLTSDRLRILGYHGVTDANQFDQHMEYIATRYNPVSESQVLDRVQRETPLPDLAVWVTFDDGEPSVVRDGLPSLIRHQIPATMFVCPGLIQSETPFWWRITEWISEHHPEMAEAFGAPADLTEHVKTLPDDERRRILAILLAKLGSKSPTEWQSLSVSDLNTWTAAGMTVGNHSWDHPCLDRCVDRVQRSQIKEADDWLTQTLGHRPKSFAYPNGNYSGVVDSELEELGYQLALLYDNTLTTFRSPTRQLSRLMIESDHSVDRLIGVMSGVQPALRTLVSRWS